jgi:hypothetical protein
MNAVKVSIAILIGFILLVTLVTSYFSAIPVANDSIRATDINLIQAFLKAYKDNEGLYPAMASNQPVGWQTYLDSWPQAPAQSSNCNAANNNYQYSAQNSRESYELSFCLGRAVAGFSKGLNNLGPKDYKN